MDVHYLIIKTYKLIKEAKNHQIDSQIWLFLSLGLIDSCNLILVSYEKVK